MFVDDDREFRFASVSTSNFQINNKCEITQFCRENHYVVDMNDYVKKQKIKNIGFDAEIEKLIKGLSKLKKNNVVILGKAGIGKTSLVERLCELINKGEVPKMLKNKTILEVSLNGAMAGTQYRGAFEDKIQKLINLVINRDDIILFIDEIHNLINCNNNDNTVGLADTLKPYLARGEFSLIGATTLKEYEESIAKDPALERRFYKLNLEEPSEEKVINILQKSKNQYEKHYDVKLNKNDILKIVELAKNRKGAYPDKAFDELEDYCYLKSKEVVSND